VREFQSKERGFDEETGPWCITYDFVDGELDGKRMQVFTTERPNVCIDHLTLFTEDTDEDGTDMAAYIHDGEGKLVWGRFV
jgi:hypothetical protein